MQATLVRFTIAHTWMQLSWHRFQSFFPDPAASQMPIKGVKKAEDSSQDKSPCHCSLIFLSEGVWMGEFPEKVLMDCNVTEAANLLRYES